jgi:hypothetical protein
MKEATHMSDTTQTPLNEILDAGHVEKPSPAEPQQQVQPSATDTDPQDIPLYDEGPADGATDPHAYRGVKSALMREREHKRAYAARNRELEAEVAELRASVPDREAQQRQQFWDAPEDHLAKVERQANFRGSRAEFIAEHGKARLTDLEQAIASARQAGHPDVPLLAMRMQASDDPVGEAMRFAEHFGLLGEPDNSGVARTLGRGPTFPTALESVRNVGARRGPAWTGPTPLADIFKR